MQPASSKYKYRDVPGGPEVKNPPYNAGHAFDPWLGNWDPICWGATKSAFHSCWAFATQLKRPCTLMKIPSATPKTQHSQRKKERNIYWGSQMAQIVKNLPATQKTHCLENSMDRRAWWAIVHGVTKESDATERLTHISILNASMFLLNEPSVQ